MDPVDLIFTCADSYKASYCQQIAEEGRHEDAMQILQSIENKNLKAYTASRLASPKVEAKSKYPQISELCLKTTKPKNRMQETAEKCSNDSFMIFELEI